jgi:YD repeat-containing protein
MQQNTFRWIAGSEAINKIGVNGATRYVPSFTPDQGNLYSLTPPSAGGNFRRLTEDGPFQDDFGRLYSGQDPYFGGVYKLRQSDTRTQQLAYDILVGKRGEVRMTAHRVSDKYGNALIITDDGIDATYIDPDKRTNPGQTEVSRNRGVRFQRDWKGRITQITDPSEATLLYRYDSQGRLTEFYDRRATERIADGISGNEFSPTKYVYDIKEAIRRHELVIGATPGEAELDAIVSQIPGNANYLSQIIDPLGVDALRAEYGRDPGRLRRGQTRGKASPGSDPGFGIRIGQWKALPGSDPGFGIRIGQRCQESLLCCASTVLCVNSAVRQQCCASTVLCVNTFCGFVFEFSAPWG